MVDISKAFEAESGFFVYDENGNAGPFFTGGASDPLGLDLPVDTVYCQNKGNGFLIWRKFGTGLDDWTFHDNNIRNEPINHVLNIPASTSLQISSANLNREVIVDGELFVI